MFTQLSDTVEFTDEKVRWRARDVSFMAGRWGALSARIPRFTVEDFKAKDDGPVNPYMRTVVRQPLTVTEYPIPVGVVSNSYTLAQHTDVVEMCFKGLRAQKIDPSVLRCEVGLTPLGEWMNFRAYFSEKHSYTPSDGKKLTVRLECFNSVDGSSRLVILLSWFRLICSNGMIIRETQAALRDIHNEHLNMDVIPEIIAEGLSRIEADLEHLQRWESSKIELSKIKNWIDGYLSEKWGKKAACRIFHICRSGIDVELADPFVGGKASEKPVNPVGPVPGAAKPVKNLYDVCQAMSWIATHRNNADERLEWQGHIPEMIDNLRSHLKAA